MSLSAGDKLGPYEILAPIGAGGMGEVFRAHDPRLSRDVAVKVSAERFSDRFRIEARAIAAINHPNVCTLYDVGPDFLVMELVEGQTLAERIKQGQIPLDDALSMARQVAEALDAAHEKGVVHRDLKPANIKIKPDGTVKVLDFGLAKSIELASGDPQTSPTVSASPTRTGMILGTAAYMSPEQARGKTVDKRADIWAFGVVLYEMLTGSRPFQGEDLADTLASVMKDKPDLSIVPIQFRRLIGRCLEKDLRKRLRDIGDVSMAIEDALTSSSGAYEAMAQLPPSAARWRASKLVWAAVAALVIATGFGLWTLSAELATPTPRVLRVAVSLPASQKFVSQGGNTVMFTPDGKAILYSGRGPHFNQLYYRRLDQLEGTAVPGTEDSDCWAISLSGDWVAFDSGVNEIWKVPLRGGARIKLGSVHYSGGLSFGPDGSIYSAEAEAGLFRFPPNGGPKQRIAEPDRGKHELGWYMPMALPDNKSVLVGSTTTGGNALVKVRIADGAATVLEGEGGNPVGVAEGYLLFGRGGTLAAVPFDVDRTHSVEAIIPVQDAPFNSNSGIVASLSSAGDLVYVKAAGLSRVTFLDALGHVIGGYPEGHNFNPSGPRISPDGKQIAIVDATNPGRPDDVWLYDLVSGTGHPITSGIDARTPEWTPDGHRVLFIVRPDSGGPWEAWWTAVDRSSPPERLVTMPIQIRKIVLSPDSRFAVMEVLESSNIKALYVVDLKGNRKPVPLEQSSFDNNDPRISPDGHWLTYVSDESGHDEVYLRPFPGGGAHVQVSTDGGDDPRWEKDSRSIVYHNADRFMKAHLAPATGMSVVKRDLLFSGPYDGYDLGPNGSIVALRPDSADAEIIVVTNWIAELKAKLGKK